MNKPPVFATCLHQKAGRFELHSLSELMAHINQTHIGSRLYMTIIDEMGMKTGPAEKSVTATCTVNNGGRARLPRRLLTALDVRDGDQLVFFLKEGKKAAIVCKLDDAIRPEAVKWP